MSLNNIVNQYAGSDNEILESVRQHTETSGKLLSSEVVIMYLVKHNLYTTFLESENPLCAATRFTLASLGEFNFIKSHSKGLMNIQSLEILIDQGIATEGFKMDLINEANTAVTPYINTTIQDIWAVTKPANWVFVTDNVINNKRTDITARLKLVFSEEVSGTNIIKYKVSGRMSHEVEYIPIPITNNTLELDVTQNTSFLDIKLPFDRLTQQYKLELKGPWEGSIVSAEYTGLVS
jgi:hypothetical protein